MGRKQTRTLYTACQNCGIAKNKPTAAKLCRPCRGKLNNSMTGKKHVNKAKFRKHNGVPNINYDDRIYNKFGVALYRMSCCKCGKDRGYKSAADINRVCVECFKEKTKSRYSKHKKRIRNAMSANLRSRLKYRLLGKNKKSTFDILPYSVDELMTHLEKRFKPGMDWTNFGHYPDGKEGWQIDHIVPEVNFNYKTTSDKAFQKCWSLANLQPLWAWENRTKRDKILNRYIVFEGTDGAGKTTHSKSLVERLIAKGYKAVWTREPGSPLIDLNVRDFVLSDKKIDPRALELLLEADRAEHTAKILQLLNEGYWVISDRSFISGLVYGLANNPDLPPSVLEGVMDFAIQCLPTHVFFFDIPPEEAEKRRIARGEALTREEKRGDAFSNQLAWWFRELSQNSEYQHCRYAYAKGVCITPVDGTLSKDAIKHLIDEELGIL